MAKKTVQSEFADLEHRMRSRAAEDGDIYLPNAVPIEPANYVFICMEPSLSGWAGRNGAQAQTRLDDGYRNFLWSMDDFVFHYSIQCYLLKPGQCYHVTDVSKGAMTVNKAQVARESRYRHWYDFLLAELELLARPDACCFAVGHAVADFLTTSNFPFSVHRILHYSHQAAASRKKSVVGHEAEFDEFRKTVLTEDVLNTAKQLLVSCGMSVALRDEILLRLKQSGPLTESRQMLAYHYKQDFQHFLSTQVLYASVTGCVRRGVAR